MKYYFFLFFLLCVHLTVIAQTLTGKVVSISDGDTFTLLSASNKQTKIRLHGIDCPEKGQDFSTAAKHRLSKLIFQQTVTVEALDVDRYGRTIGMVTVEGQNVNEILLAEGLAWHFKRYDNTKAWHELQVHAQSKKLGIWSKPNATPPWDFRKLK